MKTLTFIHTADWHADSDPKNQEKLKASLDQMLDYVGKNEVDAIIHCGDIWDSSQDFNGKSGVPLIQEYLRKLSLHVGSIFITKGNNSHDPIGSVSLLHQLESNIYAYEYPVVLAVQRSAVFDLLSMNPDEHEEVEYIVSLVPYPTKSMFVSNQSIDNNNADFIEKFEQIFELIGDTTQEYICPKILGFHGNVVGSRLSSGQSLVSQDIMVAPSTLEKANADYYALGHIHLRQEIQPFKVYSGSIYNKNWGETEQKSVEVITISENGGLEYKPFPLHSSKPMITVNLHFTNGKFEFDSGEDEDVTGIQFAEFRVRVDVKENERNLITDDSIGYLKTVYGQDAKIEITTIPNQRESRSEEIMKCKTLREEVVEYASVINGVVTSEILSKVDSVQYEVVL